MIRRRHPFILISGTLLSTSIAAAFEQEVSHGLKHFTDIQVGLLAVPWCTIRAAQLEGVEAGDQLVPKSFLEVAHRSETPFARRLIRIGS
jgi:hypothetical protein